MAIQRNFLHKSTKDAGAIIKPKMHVHGKDEHSIKAQQCGMQKEFKKRAPNMSILAPKMKLTFSFRRKMINEGRNSRKYIKAKYPFLFECDQM